MSARHLFPHVVAEIAAIIGEPDSHAEDALGVRATWRVQNHVGIEHTIVVRWCPARPERVEGAGVNPCVLATTEPLLMPQVWHPESMLNGLVRVEALPGPPVPPVVFGGGVDPRAIARSMARHISEVLGEGVSQGVQLNRLRVKVPQS